MVKKTQFFFYAKHCNCTILKLQNGDITYLCDIITVTHNVTKAKLHKNIKVALTWRSSWIIVLSLIIISSTGNNVTNLQSPSVSSNQQQNDSQWTKEKASKGALWDKINPRKSQVENAGDLNEKLCDNKANSS